MAESFTVFEKFGEVCAELREDDRRDLIYAINMYGMFGEEVELPYLLKALFVSLKEDIDNSKAMRTRGSKGGRPKAKQEVSDEAKPLVSETEKPEVSKDAKPVVSDEAEPVVSAKTEKTESQTNPNQTKPIQSNRGEGRAKAARFTPPTVGQVAAYVEERGLGIDPALFCDYYAANGWKVGRSPMKDWKAALRNWERRDADERKEAEHEALVFGDW